MNIYDIYTFIIAIIQLIVSKTGSDRSKTGYGESKTRKGVTPVGRKWGSGGWKRGVHNQKLVLVVEKDCLWVKMCEEVPVGPKQVMMCKAQHKALSRAKPSPNRPGQAWP